MNEDSYNAYQVGMIVGRVRKTIGGNVNETVLKIARSDCYKDLFEPIPKTEWIDDIIDCDSSAEELLKAMGGKGPLKNVKPGDDGMFKADVFELLRTRKGWTARETADFFEKYGLFEYLDDMGEHFGDGVPTNVVCELWDHLEETYGVTA